MKASEFEIVTIGLSIALILLVAAGGFLYMDAGAELLEYNNIAAAALIFVLVGSNFFLKRMMNPDSVSHWWEKATNASALCFAILGFFNYVIGHPVGVFYNRALAILIVLFIVLLFVIVIVNWFRDGQLWSSRQLAIRIAIYPLLGMWGWIEGWRVISLL
jgi:hypothetical protein